MTRVDGDSVRAQCSCRALRKLANDNIVSATSHGSSAIRAVETGCSSPPGASHLASGQSILGAADRAYLIQRRFCEGGVGLQGTDGDQLQYDQQQRPVMQHQRQWQGDNARSNQQQALRCKCPLLKAGCLKIP